MAALSDWRLCALQWDLVLLGLGTLGQADIGKGISNGNVGPKTRAAIGEYQLAVGAKLDGLPTAALASWVLCDRRARERRDALPSFRGWLGFVLRMEGHRGRPYWPGAYSGVTLDPGADLRFVSEDRVRQLYALLDVAALAPAFGVSGALARELCHDPLISKIRISRDSAALVLPELAAPYWDAVTDRFPDLLLPSTPGSVQTALLSLAFNRGSGNAALAVLREPLRDRQWDRLASTIAGMAAEHRDVGLKERRRTESALVTDSLRSQ